LSRDGAAGRRAFPECEGLELTVMPTDAAVESRRAFSRTDPDDMRYGLRISVWVRWFLLVAWLAQFNYRPDFAHPAYVPTMVLAVSLLALNAYLHYRLWSNRPTTWRWALLLSVMDVLTVTAGLVISSSRFQNTFFVLYYPVLATFAAVFTSFRLSFLWVTIVSAGYAALSLLLEPGVNFGIKEEKVLFTRIVVMYAVVAAVNLISRFERIKRIEAVERERELQRERIETSQTIHDTVAQSAYLMGLGLETAMELANSRNGENRDELLAKLSATHAISKATMWEIRHPIGAGLIFEGRELGRVLKSHASTFTAITSIPTDFDQSGREPELSAVSKSLLFSIAHNAMTNAYRHSGASRVRLSLGFEEEKLRMAVSDDGVGLPADYEQRGHGCSRMRTDAQRLGGRLEASAYSTGRGTTVSCIIPLDATQGGQ